MWRVSFLENKAWRVYSEEGKPVFFKTHEAAYSTMMSLQKEGFEAYTERAYA